MARSLCVTASVRLRMLASMFVAVASMCLCHISVAANSEFVPLVSQCSLTNHLRPMGKIVRVESTYGAYKIGVVDGYLSRQPKTLQEAVAVAEYLQANGWNYSVGYAMINKTNFKKFGLTNKSAFDPCLNLRVGTAIFDSCYSSAKRQFGNSEHALHAAYSCYYSGNFKTGFTPDFKGQPSYVMKVASSADGMGGIEVVPTKPNKEAKSDPAPPLKVTPRRSAPKEPAPKREEAEGEAEVKSTSSLIF